MKNEIQDKNSNSLSANMPTEPHPEFRVALDWLRQHGSFLVLALGAVVLVSTGTAVFRVRSSRSETEAAAQLGMARTADDFKAVAERFPKTSSGSLAMLGAASEHFRHGDFSDSSSAYDRFLARYPDHPMASVARLNRAACEEALGQWQRAQAEYESMLAERPEPHVAPQAVLGLGRVLSAQGNDAEARAAYEDFLLRYPGSDWNAQVEDALREVNRRIRQGGSVSQTEDRHSESPDEAGL